MSRLLLRDIRLLLAIKYLVQFQKVFESSYKASFDETRREEVRKDRVSFGFLIGVVEATYQA